MDELGKLAAEGDIAVPGGMLRYRLSGPADAAHTVVLENGWSASYAYMHWIEQALSRQVRVLAYDRAGIGYSRSSAPLSAAGMTLQLGMLLSTLGIQKPVTVLGHSYGGLIGVLHSVQQPALVESIVQIDPTPEFDDAVIDPSFKIVPLAARFMQLCSLLQIKGSLHSILARHLPAEIMTRLHPSTRWSLKSLNGSVKEIRLLHPMRRLIADSKISDRCPRLVISAAPAGQTDSKWIGRLLESERKAQRFRHATHAVHRRQAALNAQGRWMSLPYDHVGLIVQRDSAEAIATRTLAFLSERQS